MKIVTGQWFSPGGRFAPKNKTDLHDITEILWKETLNHTGL